MAAVTDLVPDIRSDIPEIPSFVASRQILRSVRELAERARVWRVDVSLSTIADTPTIALLALLPANTQLVDVISIKNTGGGAPLVPSTQAWLDTNISDWRNESNDDSKYYMLESDNTIRLAPTPASTTADLYFARLAVKPLLTATVVDDVVFNKYDELIIHGALGRLYALPRKPWTDFNLAQYHQAQFMTGIPSARTEAADEFQTGIPRKVKYGGL